MSAKPHPLDPDFRRKQLAYEAHLESQRSTGWVSKDHALYENEHLPEFPAPQGPSASDLITELHDRFAVQREDKFVTFNGSNTAIGRPLNFN